MVFSSYLFLFVFLPIFLGCYALTPGRFKNATLCVASYVFYAWGAPAVAPILCVSSLIDYLLGKAIHAAPQPKRKRRLLTIGLVLNIGALVYYKYANFFVGEVNRVLTGFEAQQLPWVEIALPIGISFFTFQKISYLVDVYRGTVPPAQSALSYLVYVAMFPQLIAGPIIRYHDVARELEERDYRENQIFYGVTRFCIGLGKKVLFADVLGAVADNVFDLDPGQRTLSYAWLGIFCYSFQIYFDFSGYSDMAIGLGRVLGFRFIENFDRPYIAQSFTEFWRRWHISLSNWMREYLYIPLGGNRVSTGRMYLNLWIVFLLSGLWHGASWNFVVWGLVHGTFLALDKLVWLKISKRLPKLLNIAITFVLVMIGWVFFRSNTLPEALSYLHSMFDLSSVHAESLLLRGLIIHNRAIVVLIIGAVVAFASGSRLFERCFVAVEDALRSPRLTVLHGSLALVCLLLAAAALATEKYSPFLYFRF